MESAAHVAGFMNKAVLSADAMASIASNEASMRACMESTVAKSAIHGSAVAENAIRNSATALSVMDDYSVTDVRTQSYGASSSFVTYHSGKAFAMSYTVSAIYGKRDARTAVHTDNYQDYTETNNGIQDLNRMYEPFEARASASGGGSTNITITAKWVIMDN